MGWGWRTEKTYRREGEGITFRKTYSFSWQKRRYPRIIATK